MEELLQASRRLPRGGPNLDWRKRLTMLWAMVPELVAYDAGTVFTEAKARSLEDIFAEG